MGDGLIAAPQQGAADKVPQVPQEDVRHHHPPIEGGGRVPQLLRGVKLGAAKAGCRA